MKRIFINDFEMIKMNDKIIFGKCIDVISDNYGNMKTIKVEIEISEDLLQDSLKKLNNNKR